MKKFLAIVSIFLGSLSGAFAQPAEGKPGVTPTPLGGVELLIAAGAALGAKKAWDKKRKGNE